MPTGRPSKLTPELLAEAERWLRVTPYEQTVADYLGIDRMTWYRWAKRGEREVDTIYGQFRYMVKKSKAAWEIATLIEARKGGDNWQRFAWMLERAIPSRWGKRLELVLKDRAEQLAAETGISADRLIAGAERIASNA